jgi:hypothetical protein
MPFYSKLRNSNSTDMSVYSCIPTLLLVYNMRAGRRGHGPMVIGITNRDGLTYLYPTCRVALLTYFQIEGKRHVTGPTNLDFLGVRMNRL